MASWRLGLLLLVFRGPASAFNADFNTLAAMVALATGRRRAPGPSLAETQSTDWWIHTAVGIQATIT
jgi:hypothetical protein